MFYCCLTSATTVKWHCSYYMQMGLAVILLSCKMCENCNEMNKFNYCMCDNNVTLCLHCVKKKLHRNCCDLVGGVLLRQVALLSQWHNM